MTYRPRPIDTSDVALPAELDGLLERLAENAHELWAEKRLADGWTYGPERDDRAKRHPNLVPYAELSGPERDYDRQVVTETLKAVVALGFTITRP